MMVSGTLLQLDLYDIHDMADLSVVADALSAAWQPGLAQAPGHARSRRRALAVPLARLYCTEAYAQPWEAMLQAALRQACLHIAEADGGADLDSEDWARRLADEGPETWRDVVELLTPGVLVQFGFTREPPSADEPSRHASAVILLAVDPDAPLTHPITVCQAYRPHGRIDFYRGHLMLPGDQLQSAG